MPIYTVKQGDCVSSIAKEHGFFWETLWNLGANAELKNKRKDPNILEPGDELEIPELRKKEEDRAPEAKHTFKRKGVPAKLRLRFTKPKEQEPKDEQKGNEQESAALFEDADYQPVPAEEEPRKNEAYTLIIDGTSQQGETDGDGRIEVTLPPNAQQGTVIFNIGQANEERHDLGLGNMDPVSTTDGARKRLSNLGYNPEEKDESDPQFQSAVRKFQEDQGLEVTGNLDEKTRDAILDAHGC